MFPHGERAPPDHPHRSQAGRIVGGADGGVDEPHHGAIHRDRHAHLRPGPIASGLETRRRVVRGVDHGAPMSQPVPAAASWGRPRSVGGDARRHRRRTTDDQDPVPPDPVRHPPGPALPGGPHGGGALGGGMEPRRPHPPNLATPARRQAALSRELADAAVEDRCPPRLRPHGVAPPDRAFGVLAGGVASPAPSFKIGQGDRWPSSLAWSNLYRVTGQRAGNPSAPLARLQRAGCTALLAADLHTLAPRRLLLLTGGDWAAPFTEALGMRLTPGGGVGVAARGDWGPTRVVVADHPQCRPRDPDDRGDRRRVRVIAVVQGQKNWTAAIRDRSARAVSPGRRVAATGRSSRADPSPARGPARRRWP